VFFGGGFERTTIKPAPTSRPRTWPMPTSLATPATVIPLTMGWSRDDRDSALAPNNGRYQRLNAEWGVAGDARYLRANYQYQQYIPLNKQFTLAFNGEAGLGQGPGRRRSRCSRTSTRVAWVRCVALTRAPWARAT
jgi:outer membrane protein insertion porin family